MKPTSVRLESDTVADLDDEADAEGLSRNGYLQEIIRHRNDYQELKRDYEELRSDYAELKAEHESLETETERLRAAQQTDNEDREERVAEVSRLREQVNRLQRKEDQHELKLTAANSRQDDLGELVEYVEDEKSLAERRENRAHAPAWRRAKWWLFGTPEDEATV